MRERGREPDSISNGSVVHYDKGMNDIAEEDYIQMLVDRKLKHTMMRSTDRCHGNESFFYIFEY